MSTNTWRHANLLGNGLAEVAIPENFWLTYLTRLAKILNWN
jgi:hypothetical protein